MGVLDFDWNTEKSEKENAEVCTIPRKFACMPPEKKAKH
jgi:hypothetical protein